MNPVAKRLPVHGADSRSFRPALAFTNSSQSEKPPGLARIARFCCRVTQLRRAKLRHQFYRRDHRSPRISAGAGRESQSLNLQNPIQARVSLNDHWYNA
jgi:hypothetical protein